MDNPLVNGQVPAVRDRHLPLAEDKRVTYFSIRVLNHLSADGQLPAWRTRHKRENDCHGEKISVKECNVHLTNKEL